MRKSTFLLLFLLLLTGIQSFAASLPIKGGYYRIRNFTANTFIGGTGTGNGSVIHQLPSVDSLYQIFKVTVNSYNGYFNFQQKATGLFITHDNSWNGSYAAKVPTTRQCWFIDNTTSADYCIINRVKDDNSHTAGLGYDQAAAGSTLYADKNTSKQNKWIFEPILSLDIADLQALIDQATALNPTALASNITAASAFLTSTSESEVLNASATLQAAIDNYKVSALLESAKSATEAAPVDVTALLVNPGFEEGFIGWNNTNFGLQSNAWPKKTDTYFAEKWITASQNVPNSSISQGLKMDVLNGKYKLVATAQALQQALTPPLATSPTGVSLFGNMASIEVGDSAVYTLENIIVVDKKLTIGFKSVSATANWIAVDNFKLYYQGVDLNALANTLSGLITTGTAFTGTVQTSVSSELAAAIAEANTVMNNKTEATLNASIARMGAAIAAANASKTAYADLQTSISNSQALIDTYTGQDVVKTSINASIATTQGVYDAHALDVAGVKAAKDSLSKWVIAFQMDYASLEKPVELTSLIVNQGFDQNTGTGWTGANGAASYNEYELYGKSTLDFNQTITGLKKGQYRVTVQGFHRTGNYSDELEAAYDNGTEVMPIVLYANTKTSRFSSAYSDKTCDATSGTWIDGSGRIFPNTMATVSTMFLAGKYANNSVIGYVGDNGILKFGIKNDGTPANASWTIFDNFRLYYVGLPALDAYMEDLNVIYGAAEAVKNAIDVNTQVSPVGQAVIGKYKYSDYRTLDSLMTVVNDVFVAYVDGNYKGTVSDVVALQAALQAAKVALVIYQPKNELPNGEYYIKVGDMFYWNNPGVDLLANDAKIAVSTQGLVMDMNVTDGSQIVKVAKISGVDNVTPIARYSMFSVRDNRNITENAIFRDSWGTWDGGSDDEWRTHNIYYNGVEYAIQADGSSANKGFWSYNANEQSVVTTGVQTVVDTLYDFSFIPVSTVFATEVAKGRTTFNAAVVGTGVDQYPQNVYNAFKTALEAAEAKKTAGTAKSADLFAYEAALNAFLTKTVALKDVSNNPVNVFGDKGMIRVQSDKSAMITVYSLTGKVVSSTISTGSRSINVAPGCYFVRIDGKTTKVMVR